ncbi:MULTISPECIES: phage tail domain-containing protein [Bacillus]|uniref:phage tail domain-containing protein n=1 Tax=Bacillus TaxID=1386 RepID=UPI000A301D3E|nr:phage tail domain-containing protein [Bacillus cereus]MBR3337520.1 phage tail family protein [Bacillus sp. (in: firmicutes)]ASK16551.1 phage tail protein [Bacillus cereus]MBL3784018.1 phage tail family protein [Bacillus cereus]MBL3799029.1 phage tail family protein [Bacillus cereus]MBL3815542.1 phage tail family protein [Bacillus cereus]
MITLDDKYRFEDFGFICEPGYDDSITPIFDRKTYSIPGVEGVIPFGTEVKEKPFSYPLMIMERFHIEMQRKFEMLTDFFFDQYGNPRKIKMVRDYDPSKFYYVELAQQITPDRLPEDGKFVLPLVAYDPRSYSIVKSTDKITWGTRIPFATKIPFSYRSGQSVYDVNVSQNLTVNNIGSIVVRPIVEIIGVATALTLTVNGESFSFGDLNNEKLLIDAATYTVIKNGGNHLFNTVGNLEKLELFPGENIARIGGANLNIKITFNFRGKYK